MDRNSRQKTNKTTEILNDKIQQLDLIGIFQDIISKNKTKQKTRQTN